MRFGAVGKQACSISRNFRATTANSSNVHRLASSTKLGWELETLRIRDDSMVRPRKFA